MDFSIGGIEYKAGKIDARKQFHIVRRILPVLTGDGKGVDNVLTALSTLSDDDADYVLFGLLACVKQKQNNGLGWAPISTGNQLMVADLQMADMLKIAVEAFKANMSDFLAMMPSGLAQVAE